MALVPRLTVIALPDSKWLSPTGEPFSSLWPAVLVCCSTGAGGCSTLRTPAYVVRSAVHTPQLMVLTKQVLRRAFELQAANRCFTFVEILSTCPTNWGMSPVKALSWLQENMMPYYPIGVFKDPDIAETAAGLVPTPRKTLER